MNAPIDESECQRAIRGTDRNAGRLFIRHKTSRSGGPSLSIRALSADPHCPIRRCRDLENALR